jgi:hypothetical protein
MKRLFFPVALSILAAASAAPAQAPLPAKMRPAKAADRQAAIRSIQAQLKAFGRDDYKTAVTYQSAGLKRNFPSTEAFRAMMVRTYPEFAHYKTVTFGPAQSDTAGNHLAILASVTGQDGITKRAVYLMVREGKVYRVEGVAGGAQMRLEDSGPSKDV